MSAILAIVRHGGTPVPDSTVQRALWGMRHRGQERLDVWRDQHVVLAVQRFAWESSSDIAGPVMLAHDENFVVAADARLFYRDELRRALGNHARAGDNTPTALIAAAYRAFGDQCVDRLEGDFAFVVWDRRQLRLLAARSPSAVRPLHMGRVGGCTLLASTVGAFAAHPEFDDRFDLGTLAIDALGEYTARGTGTVFAAVEQVAPATTLTAPLSGPTSVRRFWHAPTALSSTRPLAEASEALRTVLGAAVRERAAPDSPTAIWMSGGYDSVALFAIGRGVSPQNVRALQPVSFAFPKGDSGYEAPLVDLVAQHAGVPVRWTDAYGAEFGRTYLKAGDRDEPFTSVHSETVEALAATGAAEGMHVALNGHGGDGLFSASPGFLADLVRRGQFGVALSEAGRLFPKAKVRRLASWGVLPLVPPSLLSVAGALRGHAIHMPMRGSLSPLLRADFVRANGLADRLDRASPAGMRRRGESWAEVELRFFLENPGIAHWSAVNGGLALRAGVESHSPFLDGRVIRYVCEGTREERVRLGETKLLLREAMKPFVPQGFADPRAGRTGTLRSRGEVLLARMRPLFEQWFQSPVLADLGLVEPATLQAALGNAERRPWDMAAIDPLLSMASCEAWLRSRNSIDDGEFRGEIDGFPSRVSQHIAESKA